MSRLRASSRDLKHIMFNANEPSQALTLHPLIINEVDFMCILRHLKLSVAIDSINKLLKLENVYFSFWAIFRMQINKNV